MSDCARPLSVLFDSGPLGTGSYFAAPSQIIEAWEPSEVQGAFQTMEAARRSGKWLAGAASYELGYVLIPKIADRLPATRAEPLLRFGVFETVQTPPEVLSNVEFELDDFEPLWDENSYRGASINI